MSQISLVFGSPNSHPTSPGWPLIRICLFFFCAPWMVVFAQDEKADPTAPIRERQKAWATQAEALKQGNATPAAAARASLLELAADAAERHLQAIRLRDSSEARLKSIEKQAAEWKGPEGRPPYSWLLADRYRGTFLAAEDAIAVATGFKKVVEASLRQASDRLLAEDAAVRRMREELEKAGDEAAASAARDALEDAILRLNTAAEEKAAAEVQLASVDTTLKVERARAAFAKRQLDALGTSIVFTDEELKAALAIIDENRARLLADQQKSTRALRSSVNLRISQSGLTSRGDVLGWQIGLLDLRREMLETRHRWLNSAENEAAATEKRRLAELFTRPEMWRGLFDSRQRVLRAAMTDLENAAQPATESDAAFLSELKATDREFQLAIEQAGEIANLRRIWMPDGTKEDGKIGFSSWMRMAAGQIVSTLRALWEFEVYTVEETVTLEDGRSFPAKRAITLGKLLFLTGIITIGYFLLRALSTRLAERIRVRFHLDPTKAQVVRRWFLILGMCLLGLYALHYARIPLTAFAFLGGALAIGVGFGTQNLIRNFISGLLVQAEKPIKTGDVVDVGGIQGTVTSIGMRASIIRHWDGIETVIPNSVFLENNVTNWTHTDHILRSSVRMGVDYGTNPDKVTRLLLEIAKANQEVLVTPEPFVLFEDFADSSLIFVLYFWIDMRKSGRTQVASQLRHAIARVFEEHSVSMAYPQRDMHLSTKEPLLVRVTRDE